MLTSCMFHFSEKYYNSKSNQDGIPLGTIAHDEWRPKVDPQWPRPSFRIVALMGLLNLIPHSWLGLCPGEKMYYHKREEKYS